MDTYFKFKLIADFGIPAIIILMFLIVISYFLASGYLKSKLMKKLGYRYKKGLGSNVAHEFQSQWIKGNIKINYKRIDAILYWKIRKYINEVENKQI